MDISPETIGMAGGAGSAGAFGIWLIKRMIDRLETGMKELATEVTKTNLNIAQLQGKDEILWREINSKGDRIVKLEASQEKAWDVISKIAPKRVSDRVSE